MDGLAQHGRQHVADRIDLASAQPATGQPISGTPQTDYETPPSSGGVFDLRYFARLRSTLGEDRLVHSKESDIRAIDQLYHVPNRAHRLGNDRAHGVAPESDLVAGAETIDGLIAARAASEEPIDIRTPSIQNRGKSPNHRAPCR